MNLTQNPTPRPNADSHQEEIVTLPSLTGSDVPSIERVPLISSPPQIDRRSFFRGIAGAVGSTVAITQAAAGSTLSSTEGDSGQIENSDARVSITQDRGGIIDVRVLLVDPAQPGIKHLGAEAEKLHRLAAVERAKVLAAEMERASVKVVFAHGRADGPPGDPLGVHEALAVASLVPGVKVIGIANPTQTGPAHMALVERELETKRDKIVGLMTYNGYFPFGPDDEVYEPYYRLASKYRLPVFLTVGDVWSSRGRFKFSEPYLADEVAVRHPDIRFVINHFGVPHHRYSAEIMVVKDNIYTDLSGLFVADDKLVQKARENALPDVVPLCAIKDVKDSLVYLDRWDRVLFGSDWPFSPMANYREVIQAIVPKEHHNKVFRKNAEQLFLISF
jgi:uncharacterized protein